MPEYSELLAEQNPWWVDKNAIYSEKEIVAFNDAKFKKIPSIRYKINLEIDVLYSLRGPRQIGKTTLIKLLIKELIEKGTKPENILFFSCETLDRRGFRGIIEAYLNFASKNSERKYLFFDEICSVKLWDKELLSFYNKAKLNNCSIIVSGSYAVDLKNTVERLPGRRGGVGDSALDKILLPMKFSEYITFVHPKFKQKLFDFGFISNADKKEKMFKLFSGKIDNDIEGIMVFKKCLDSWFDEYLICGGIPKVINEFHTTSEINESTYQMYLAAIMGDLNKQGLKQTNVKEVMGAIINTVASQINWSTLAKNTTIKHHDTIASYVEGFEKIFLAGVAHDISITRKKSFKGNKKIYLQDQFIFHAMNGLIRNASNSFSKSKNFLLRSEQKAGLVETVVYNHLCRFAYGLAPNDLFNPSNSIFFHRCNGSEIDFVIDYDEILYPVEVKYQNEIQSKDYFNFRSFKKGIIVSKNELAVYNQYTCVPASVFLLLI